MLSLIEKGEFKSLKELIKNENEKKADFLKELLWMNCRNSIESFKLSKKIYENFQTQNNKEKTEFDFLNNIFYENSFDNTLVNTNKDKNINYNKNNLVDKYNIYKNDINYNQKGSKFFLSNKNNNIYQTNQTNNPNESNQLKEYKIELIQSLEMHEDTVRQIAWHPKDDLFASCTCDKNIYIWGYDFIQKKYIIKAILEESNTSKIKSLCWDNTGNYLASTSFEININIWKKDGLEFDCIATLEGHENEIKNIAWSISGKFLTTCSEKDKGIWIWRIHKEDEFNCDSIIQAHEDNVNLIKWSPVDDAFFSVGFDNMIKVWGMDRGNEREWILLNTLRAHGSIIWGN